MLITPIITKLTNDCTLVTAVEYAHNANAALSDNLPIIYVTPMAESSEPSRYDNFIQQRVVATFSVTIGVHSQNDELQAIRNQVFGSLLGFVPATGYDAIEYDNGDLLDLTTGVMWWRDVFRVYYFIKQN